MNDTSLSQFLKDVEAASYASADDIPRLMKQARENDEERMRRESDGSVNDVE